MKNSFAGYYPPSEADFQSIWEEALIVLDTNVLLNLYRLPTLARDELLGVLAKLQDRLWIPHHVALEFQRKRLSVIAGERKGTEEALTAAQSLLGDLKAKVDALQIDKRGINIDPTELLGDLGKANEKLVNAIKATHESLLDISSIDPIREKIDALIGDHVGAGPKSKDDLEKLIEGGDVRFQEKIPPGFADADKDKNPNEAFISFDHLKVPRKFGDLIIWRQLMEHARSKEIKAVLLITADRKEDWWWREQGKTIGPHPELVREIQREAGVSLFWMYSSGQFLEHANKYVQAKVSPSTVDEIKQVARQAPQIEMLEDDLEISNGKIIRRVKRPLSRPLRSQRGIEYAVEEWLNNRYENCEIWRNGQFPDFIVETERGRMAFEVISGITLKQFIKSNLIRTIFERAAGMMKSGEIQEFTLVIVPVRTLPDPNINEPDTHRLEEEIVDLLDRVANVSLIIGSVYEGEFSESISYTNGL